jgi:integrase
MSIVKRGNSKFWYIQFQMNGRTFIKSSRSTSKRVAEQMEADWRSLLHAQQFMGHRPRISLKDAFTQFCDSRRGTPYHAGWLSIAKVVGASLRGTMMLDELTSHELERFKRARMVQGVSPQTVKHNLNLVRGAWKLARKLGYLTSDLAFPEIKMGRTSVRYLSDVEESRFLECLHPRRVGKGLPPWEERDEETRRNMQDAYDLVVLLLDTGARYSEIANIEWQRVDLEQRLIRLWRPKVNNESIIYMTDRAFEVLSRRHAVKAGKHVFSNRKGEARGYASQSIRKALRAAGLADCKIHTLRHTHASRLVQNGLSIYEVREVLGHTDIKTTMRYAHLESRQVTSKARDVINRLNSARQYSDASNSVV